MRIRSAALGAVAASALAVPSAAGADPYVALGDSVAAGSGASSPASSYVGVLYSKYQSSLGADQLLNRSQGGATSTSLRNGGQLTTALADINAASDTKAVTIDIGGNDYLSGQCRTNWDDPSTCPFRDNLASILSQLQTALAGDPGDEHFAVMAYYNPGVGTSSEGTYDTGLLGANRAVGLTDTGADVGGNDVIYQEAAKLGIPVADPYPAFKAGGRALMSPDGIHPSTAGHAAIAAAFCDTAPAGSCAETEPPPPPGTDTTAPETTITKRPPNRATGHRATFRFHSSESDFIAECRLDRAGWKRCGSPKRITHLTPGRHTFRVRATDAAGNVDQTPAVDRFKLVD